MERKNILRIYNGEEAVVISRFRQILIELDRTDMGPLEQNLLEQEHIGIVEECIDRGLTEDICLIRDDYTVQKNWEKIKQKKERGEDV